MRGTLGLTFPWAGPRAGSRVTCKAQTDVELHKGRWGTSEPSREGSVPTLSSGGRRLGESDRRPGTQPRGPSGGQRGGEVADAGTDEVTALQAQLRRRAALAPAGGTGGRAAGGSAPSPRHKRSDRQGQGRDTHSETDRHARRQTHRHPQTRETATQRQAGDPRTAVRHTHIRSPSAWCASVLTLCTAIPLLTLLQGAPPFLQVTLGWELPSQLRDPPVSGVLPGTPQPPPLQERRPRDR